MADAAATLPDEPAPDDSAIVCEGCGYRLDGLPNTARCPECGFSVAQSTIDSPRAATAWERTGGLGAFIGTTARVLCSPTTFYRTLKAHPTADETGAATRFRAMHLGAASGLFAAGILTHYLVVSPTARGLWYGQRWPDWLLVVPWAVIAGLTFAAALLTAALAARLTAFEARWRGLRMPMRVARRCLSYHAAHASAAALAFATIALGYRLLWLLGLVDFASFVPYIATLSACTIVGAVYLFWTYWVGMRNMQYANV